MHNIINSAHVCQSLKVMAILITYCEFPQKITFNCKMTILFFCYYTKYKYNKCKYIVHRTFITKLS